MFYSHGKSKYHSTDPIPLSDRSIPILELRTVETEYKGKPFTDCRKNKHSSHEDLSNLSYDISVCKAARKVENIIKR